MTVKRLFTLLLLALSCATSHAYEVIVGKVTLLQPTYLPGVVSFSMDAGSPSCPAGGWLKWANADTSNNKAVYATLAAAFLAGKTAKLYVNDGDTTCTGIFLHVIN
jgi:hypothetical protein